MAELRQSRFAGFMERFERLLVFPVARGWFLLLAVAAVLSFAGGAVAGAYGLVKLPIATPDDPPPVPPAEAVTLARVEQYLAEQKAREEAQRASAGRRVFDVDEGSEDDHGRPAGDVAVRDQELTEIDALMVQLQALFPDPPHAWDDVVEVFCKNPTPYGCLAKGSRVKQRGVSGIVKGAMGRIPRRDRGDFIATLKLVIAVVGEAPAEGRAELIAPTVAVRRDVLAAHAAKLREREETIARAKAEHEREVHEQDEAKSTQRMVGLYGVGAGLALLIGVSLFLAHFAIERHMRLLQQVVAGLHAERREAPPAGPGAAQ